MKIYYFYLVFSFIGYSYILGYNEIESICIYIKTLNIKYDINLTKAKYILQFFCKIDVKYNLLINNYYFNILYYKY